MIRIVTSFAVFTATLALALPANAAGTLTRTFVSSSGVDTNPCTIAQPCATFARAYTQTVSSGIIAALDPGKYGASTIGTPITVNGNGWGAITALASSDGITVNANTTDTVTLIGLEIDGALTGSNGILFNTGGTLIVTSCAIHNMMLDGIRFFPGASSTLRVSDTVTDNNVDAGIYLAQSGTGIVTATIERVQASNNVNGIVLQGSTQPAAMLNAVIDESVAAANSNAGFGVVGPGGPAQVLVFRSVAANNQGVGLASQGNTATLWVGQSAVTGNANGWQVISSGTLLSYGDNKIDGNAANEMAPPSISNK